MSHLRRFLDQEGAHLVHVFHKPLQHPTSLMRNRIILDEQRERNEEHKNKVNQPIRWITTFNPQQQDIKQSGGGYILHLYKKTYLSYCLQQPRERRV